MKNLSIAFLAAVSLMTFAGCKKKGGDALAKAGEFRDKMCKCAEKMDKACADAVDADMMKWQGESKMSEEEKTKAGDIKKAYDECKAKAAPAMTPPPATPPPGDKPAEPAAAPPGDKPAEPAAPPAAPPGDKPAAGSN